MKAIIIAAGQGKRLRPYTDDRPKCMVEIGGKPIIQHQVDALRRSGVDDIVIIRGYKKRGLNIRGVRFVDNPHYAEHNILMSLFSAGKELVGDVIVSYGDIIYHPAIVETLLDVYAPGVLVVDRAWEKTYEGRSDHPVGEAELCRMEPHGVVIDVGKHVGPQNSLGEFIGLARISAPLVARMWLQYLQAVERGVDKPFGRAANLKEAYLTDMINVLIQDGDIFSVLTTEGAWREIDTVQDLERARAGLEWL
ncbi:phosphocholine cytidylyltransferase family protein [Myxococcota bacterium]|nr:phosphocholine cytidylyltransferase family protein [Myxococcota bacterium]MBU1430352.1 phosphocholine cytidylyltransferase family protein [Myxococcota bacterium]MBU1898186.1 phosphocholine cytidylyltransferase family protein [Myxococcota bacterium]